MILKEDIIAQVRKDVGLKRELEKVFGCSDETIRRWVRDNHIALTTFASLEVISLWLGIDKEDLVDDITDYLDIEL